MTPPAAHQSQWETSEVVFGIPLLISILLEYIWHFPIMHGNMRWLLIPAGIILAASGIGLIVAARREFSNHGQPTDPGRPTTTVITSGVFSISRNPLYLGIVVLVTGLGLALNNGWILILLIPEIIACHIVLIFPEERYLSATFGEHYNTYRQSVYRWIGRK